jgi:hypothetical protein
MLDFSAFLPEANLKMTIIIIIINADLIFPNFEINHSRFHDN